MYTPAAGNILTGITRATVLEICVELGIPVVEKQCTQEELFTADAAFFCGTAAEVIGWQSIDQYQFPLAWNESLGRQIQVEYKNKVPEKQTAAISL
jgi:branched-chain amino acid aminotransferase